MDSEGAMEDAQEVKDDEKEKDEGGSKVMVDASASADDDGDSDDDIEIDDAVLEKLASLESEIKANPNLYYSHRAYITLLTNNNLVEKARIARKDMHSRFPLSEDLWLEWLEVEMRQVEDNDGLLTLRDLFELAVHDYLSVDIWCQYLQFIIDCGGHIPDIADNLANKVRELAERAVACCGLHLSEGHNIWKTYINYEQALEADCGDSMEKSVQESTVRKLYHRVLQVPLLNGDSLMTMYQAWEAAHDNTANIPPELILNGYNSAKDMVGLRLEFEKAVGSVGNDGSKVGPDVLAAFLAYIKLEEVQNSPSRAVCMYERAISVFPVTHSLWLKYATFVETKIQTFEAARDVYKRAQRNCPWVGEVWARAIRLHDRHVQPVEDVREVYNCALAGGLQGTEEYMSVILAWLDGMRHRKRVMEEGRPGFISMDMLRKEFSSAVDVMGSYFPDYHDPTHRIAAYWAKCELAYDDNLAKAREVWNSTLEREARKYPETWLMFADMEKRLGNVKEATKLYKSAILSGALDAVQKAAVCHEWVRFEREEGTPASYRSAALKQEQVLEEILPHGEDESQVAIASRQAADKAPKLTQKEAASLKRSAQGNGAQPAAKKLRVEGEEPEAVQSQREGPKKKKRARDKAKEQFGQKVYYSDEITAFVKNLAPDTSDSSLMEFFKDFGEVKAIRHMRWPDGKSRGYAYIELGSGEALEKAILSSGRQFNGLTIIVQKSRPTKGPNQRGKWKHDWHGQRGHNQGLGQPKGTQEDQKQGDSEWAQKSGRGRWGRGRGMGMGRGRGWGRGRARGEGEVRTRDGAGDTGKSMSNAEFSQMFK